MLATGYERCRDGRRRGQSRDNTQEIVISSNMGVAQASTSSSRNIIHDALSNEFGIRDVIACTNISACLCDSITGSLMELFMRGLRTQGSGRKWRRKECSWNLTKWVHETKTDLWNNHGHRQWGNMKHLNVMLRLRNISFLRETWTMCKSLENCCGVVLVLENNQFRVITVTLLYVGPPQTTPLLIYYPINAGLVVIYSLHTTM